MDLNSIAKAHAHCIKREEITIEDLPTPLIQLIQKELEGMIDE